VDELTLKELALPLKHSQ